MPTVKSKSRPRNSKVDRRGPRRLAAVQPEVQETGVPYTMRLKDGRTIYMELPPAWVTKDRSGEIAFRPPAIELLDKVQALAMSTKCRPPTPGYLVTLRVALGLTQKEFAAKLGVDKITVSRWERGDVTPREESLAQIDKIRKAAVQRGVVIKGV